MMYCGPYILWMYLCSTAVSERSLTAPVIGDVFDPDIYHEYFGYVIEKKECIILLCSLMYLVQTIVVFSSSFKLQLLMIMKLHATERRHTETASRITLLNRNGLQNILGW